MALYSEVAGALPTRAALRYWFNAVSAYDDRLELERDGLLIAAGVISLVASYLCGGKQSPPLPAR